MEHIAESIKEFGFIQPIVVDETNTILCGHGRHLAAIKLGMEKVPCRRIVGLSAAQKTALNLADNRLQHATGMDEEQLRRMLVEIAESEYDMLRFGVSLEDVQVSDFEIPAQNDPSFQMIKQYGISFETDEFELVQRKFAEIINRRPQLEHNTGLVLRLLEEFESDRL